MLYTLEHLGENVPAKAVNMFYRDMIRRNIRQINAELLWIMMGKDPIRRLTAEQTARLQKLWARNADDTATSMAAAQQIRSLAETLREADLATLRSRLRDANPAVRQAAILIIAQRRLPLEADLIEQLRDPIVFSTAHEALVRLARGTDFGPTPGASRRGRERAVERWRQWLTLQESVSPEKLAKDLALAAGQQAKVAHLDIVPLVLAHDDRPAPPSSVAEACDELVNAKGDEQTSVLARLRDAEDNDSTEALALAIAKLSGDIQQQTRDALTARLTRLSAAELRDRLQDDNPEVRCAVALACGRKIAKEHIPDLLQLLDDPEMDVVQSARVALTELTGEDFGPSRDADRRGHTDAVAAWGQWWKQHQDSRK